MAMRLDLKAIEEAARRVVPDCHASFDVLRDELRLRAYRDGVIHEAVLGFDYLQRAIEMGGAEHLSEVVVMAAHDLEEAIDG